MSNMNNVYKKFRKKPVIIEAIRLKEPSNPQGIAYWCKGEINETKKRGIKIKTLEGTMMAKYGDWIIKGINGEFYPCKHKIFKKTYEEVKNE